MIYRIVLDFFDKAYHKAADGRCSMVWPRSFAAAFFDIEYFSHKISLLLDKRVSL
ncbi:MAG: hypothetical protein J5922_04315 [Clostridia bacterium]|nr:hypothetical protein [Clostridia bacterium]